MDRGNLLRFLDDPSIEPTNNRAERALRPAVIAAEGIALLEERRWCGCVLGLHQRNQDPGSQWRRSLAGQRALRCVQRCSGPHTLLLNPSSHSAPLINYPLAYKILVVLAGVHIDDSIELDQGLRLNRLLPSSDSLPVSMPDTMMRREAVAGILGHTLLEIDTATQTCVLCSAGGRRY